MKLLLFKNVIRHTAEQLRNLSIIRSLSVMDIDDMDEQGITITA